MLNSHAILDGFAVDIARVGRTVFQGALIGYSLLVGGAFTLTSSGNVAITSFLSLINSSTTFSGGSAGFIHQLSSGGIMTFEPSCSVNFGILSIANQSTVTFESQLGAIIFPSSIIALSGTLLASQLVVRGGLLIPAASSVVVRFPVVSDASDGCTIQVQGMFTVASYFSLTACNVSGAGRLHLLQGLVSESFITVSVSRIAISKIFAVATRSRVHFSNSSLALLSCNANVSGNITAESFSTFSLSHDSNLIAQSATLSGFTNMTLHGNISISNSELAATTVLFTNASSASCSFSTIRAGNMSTAGVICAACCFHRHHFIALNAISYRYIQRSQLLHHR